MQLQLLIFWLLSPKMYRISNYCLPNLRQLFACIPSRQVKENLVARTANILACYRKNCASPSSAGQLILPEAMKLLPLYINCLNKSDAISGGQDLACDERSWQMYILSTATVDTSVVYFYPRLLPLSDVDPQVSQKTLCTTAQWHTISHRFSTKFHILQFFSRSQPEVTLKTLHMHFSFPSSTSFTQSRTHTTAVFHTWVLRCCCIFWCTKCTIVQEKW